MEGDAEREFLKFAMPCAFVLVQRGELSQGELQRMESSARAGRPMQREDLGRIFHRAFQRLRELAAETGRDFFSIENIRDYFLRKHNELIDLGKESWAMAPPTLRHLCRVLRAEVVRAADDILVVKDERGEVRTVLRALVPKAAKGDSVIVHYGYAVEMA